MAIVKFDATFKGGITGFVEFTISRVVKNEIVKEHVQIDGSGTAEIDLPEDRYVISLFGNAPPKGASINISVPTKPKTPTTFDEGVMAKSYTMNLKDKK